MLGEFAHLGLQSCWPLIAISNWLSFSACFTNSSGGGTCVGRINLSASKLVTGQILRSPRPKYSTIDSEPEPQDSPMRYSHYVLQNLMDMGSILETIIIRKYTVRVSFWGEPCL